MRPMKGLLEKAGDGDFEFLDEAEGGVALGVLGAFPDRQGYRPIFSELALELLDRVLLHQSFLDLRLEMLPEVLLMLPGRRVVPLLQKVSAFRVPCGGCCDRKEEGHP